MPNSSCIESSSDCSSICKALTRVAAAVTTCRSWMRNRSVSAFAAINCEHKHGNTNKGARGQGSRRTSLKVFERT